MVSAQCRRITINILFFYLKLQAIELCLKSGAKISTQQHDMSTPVHLACSQGAIEIVKLMFSLQPEEKKQCLISCDIQKMTPLHCAAMFNRWEIVKYLIEEVTIILYANIITLALS